MLGKVVDEDAHAFRFGIQGFHYGLGHGHDQLSFLVYGFPLIHMDMNDRHRLPLFLSTEIKSMEIIINESLLK
jgi:hypothetical protein